MAAALGTIALAFRNADIRRLQLAAAGSMVGAWMYVVVLAVYAYQEDGAYAVGILGLARWAIAALVSPVAGAVGDRFPRVRVMVLANVTRAGAIAVIAAVAALDGPSFAAYGLAVVAAVAFSLYGPPQASLLPQLARSAEELTAANVGLSTIGGVGAFAGPACAGLALAVAGSPVGFAVAAALSLSSALFVARIHEPERERAGAGAGRRDGVLAGFRLVAAEPRLRTVVGLYGAQAVVDGALVVLIVVLALETLDLGPAGVGYLNAAAGIGGVLGAVVASTLARGSRLGSSFGAGIVVYGAPLLLVAAIPAVAPALVLFAALGIGNTLVEVSGRTLLQRVAPPESVGRVFGVLESLLFVGVALGSATAPAVVDAFGDRAAVLAFGALLPALALLSWRVLAATDAAVAPAGRLELLSRIPIFRPLDPPTLERLAASLVEVRAAAGDEVVRQGDPGDAYYVVGDGSVDVEVDGVRTGSLGPGEGFGEIALLRDVPRTATVAAASDVVLFALDRADFLAAVTGHPGSAEAAEAVVAARVGPRPTTA